MIYIRPLPWPFITVPYTYFIFSSLAGNKNCPIDKRYRSRYNNSPMLKGLTCGIYYDLRVAILAYHGA